jgi:hypothetical protein
MNEYYAVPHYNQFIRMEWGIRFESVGDGMICIPCGQCPSFLKPALDGVSQIQRRDTIPQRLSERVLMFGCMLTVELERDLFPMVSVGDFAGKKNPLDVDATGVNYGLMMIERDLVRVFEDGLLAVSQEFERIYPWVVRVTVLIVVVGVRLAFWAGA